MVLCFPSLFMKDTSEPEGAMPSAEHRIHLFLSGSGTKNSPQPWSRRRIKGKKVFFSLFPLWDFFSSANESGGYLTTAGNGARNKKGSCPDLKTWFHSLFQFLVWNTQCDASIGGSKRYCFGTVLHFLLCRSIFLWRGKRDRARGGGSIFEANDRKVG